MWTRTLWEGKREGVDDHEEWSRTRRTRKWARTMSLIQLVSWRRVCMWHKCWIWQVQVPKWESSLALGNRLVFQRVPCRRGASPVKHSRTPANTIWLWETMVWTNMPGFILTWMLYEWACLSITSSLSTLPLKKSILDSLLKNQVLLDSPKPQQNLAISLSYMYWWTSKSVNIDQIMALISLYSQYEHWKFNSCTNTWIC